MSSGHNYSSDVPSYLLTQLLIKRYCSCYTTQCEPGRRHTPALLPVSIKVHLITAACVCLVELDPPRAGNTTSQLGLNQSPERPAPSSRTSTGRGLVFSAREEWMEKRVRVESQRGLNSFEVSICVCLQGVPCACRVAYEMFFSERMKEGACACVEMRVCV